MDANVRFFVLDWKERLNGKDLVQAVKDVEALGRGSTVVDRAFDTGDDSVVTLVIPGDINDFRGLKNKDLEEVVLGWCESMHLDKDGNAFFKFSAQYEVPETDWLNENDSLAHIDHLEDVEFKLNNPNE